MGVESAVLHRPETRSWKDFGLYQDPKKPGAARISGLAGFEVPRWCRSALLQFVYRV